MLARRVVLGFVLAMSTPLLLPAQSFSLRRLLVNFV
jgi:hypothetical protein